MFRRSHFPLFNSTASPVSGKRWFEVKNLGSSMMTDGNKGTVGVITMRGCIGESNQPRQDWWDDSITEGQAGTVKELETEIVNLGTVGEIQIYITSEGGSVWDALTIADILNRHPARIVAIVEGYAFSAATILIAKCADEIRMASNAWMMIHDAESCVCGGVEDFQVAIGLLNKTNDSIAQTYAGRGGATAEEFRTLMAAESYLTGADCLARKLCDALTDEVVLTNYKPLSAAKPREKMPTALRSLFDTAKPVPADPANHNPNPDSEMKPEEVQELINKGLKPLQDKNEALETELKTTKEGIKTAIDSATKPILEDNVKLKTELEDLRKLQNNGVLEAAKGGGPVVPGAAAPNNGDSQHDLKNMSPQQLIALGRKKQTA